MMPIVSTQILLPRTDGSTITAVQGIPNSLPLIQPGAGQGAYGFTGISYESCFSSRKSLLIMRVRWIRIHPSSRQHHRRSQGSRKRVQRFVISIPVGQPPPILLRLDEEPGHVLRRDVLRKRLREEGIRTHSPVLGIELHDLLRGWRGVLQIPRGLRRQLLRLLPLGLTIHHGNIIEQRRANLIARPLLPRLHKGIQSCRKLPGDLPGHRVKSRHGRLVLGENVGLVLVAKLQEGPFRIRYLLSGNLPASSRLLPDALRKVLKISLVIPLCLVISIPQIGHGLRNGHVDRIRPLPQCRGRRHEYPSETMRMLTEPPDRLHIGVLRLPHPLRHPVRRTRIHLCAWNHPPRIPITLRKPGNSIPDIRRQRHHILAPDGHQ